MAGAKVRFPGVTNNDVAALPQVVFGVGAGGLGAEGQPSNGLGQAGLSSVAGPVVLPKATVLVDGKALAVAAFKIPALIVLL